MYLRIYVEALHEARMMVSVFQPSRSLHGLQRPEITLAVIGGLKDVLPVALVVQE